MHVVLYQPEIPPNTGNIIRICANTGASLHLIRPLGFDWDDKRLRRAGLDYHDFTRVSLYDNLSQCEEQLCDKRWFAMTTKGSRNFAEIAFQSDVLHSAELFFAVLSVTMRKKHDVRRPSSDGH